MESASSGYNPNIHHRRSIRLKGYDYSKAGMYFITICCQNRICRFGKIVKIPTNNNSFDEMVGAPLVGAQIIDGRPQGSPQPSPQPSPRPTITTSDIQVMQLNEAGKMVDEQWLTMVTRFPNIELHEYKIMPNHFHCILEIVGAPLVGTHFKDGETTELKEITGRPQGYAPTGTAPTGTAPTITAPTITASMETAPTGTPPTGTAPTITAPTEIASTITVPTDTSPTGSQNDVVKPKNKTIGDMMDAFKSIITVEYIHGVKNKGWDRFDGKLLQRDYYEHIIRNEQEYQRISEYIMNNPSNWKEDKFYFQ